MVNTVRALSLLGFEYGRRMYVHTCEYVKIRRHMKLVDDRFYFCLFYILKFLHAI